ncbi:10754_t:CDS:2, partial [Scutellospora calospora]
MGKKVLCICTFCLQETNNNGKFLSISSRTRHRKREKNIQNTFIISNNISENIFNSQINTISMEDIEKTINQNMEGIEKTISQSNDNIEQSNIESQSNDNIEQNLENEEFFEIEELGRELEELGENELEELERELEELEEEEELEELERELEELEKEELENEELE